MGGGEPVWICYSNLGVNRQSRVGAMRGERRDRKESQGGRHARTESPRRYRGTGGGGGKIWRQGGSDWQKSQDLKEWMLRRR